MEHLSSSKARTQWAEIINKVHYKGDRIIIQKHDKDLIALIPMEDLELLEVIEDYIDTQDALAELAKGEEPIPWEEVKKELDF